jgi:integrase/recombinase XerD
MRFNPSWAVREKREMLAHRLLSTLDSYQRYLTSVLGRSPHTTRAYLTDTRCFAAYVAARYPAEINTATIRIDDYAAWLREDRSNAPASVRRKLVSLRVFLDWLAKQDASPTIAASAPEGLIKLPKRLPRALDRAECEIALQRCSRSDHTAERITELAFRILIATGLRVSELCAISLGDIAPDATSIRIKGKGDKERIVYVVNSDLQILIFNEVGRRRSSPIHGDPLLISNRCTRLTPQAVRLRFHRLAVSSGITSKLTPHRLRHTAATLLIESGVDIRFVQRLLGHSSISTTEIYTKVSDTSLRAALARADLLRSM